MSRLESRQATGVPSATLSENPGYHKSSFTRRGLIRGTVLGGAAVLTSPFYSSEASASLISSPDNGENAMDPILHIEAEDPRELTFEEQKEFARRLYTNLDRMKNVGLRRGIHDADELYEVTVKMEDYFFEAGVTSQYATANTPEIHFVHYDDPDMREHVSAQSVAMSELTVNDRYTDPNDPWYDDPELIWIMAHEMGHMNGIMAPGREYTESSAQIAATAVLGAMANDGVDFAGKEIYLYAFTDLLRSMVMGSLYYRAIQEGRPMDYFNFIPEVVPGVDPVEVYNSRKEEWAGNEDEHVAILNMYSDRPLRALLRGFQSGTIPPEDVFLPINADKICAANYQCADVTQTPDKPLSINGVIAMLTTMEDKVAFLEGQQFISNDTQPDTTSSYPASSVFPATDGLIRKDTFIPFK